MSTHDNAPPQDGWRPVAKHCGLICFDKHCGVCGEWLPMPDAVLGEN